MTRKNDDSGHIYVCDKGIQVPGVTTIVSILNKPELVGWANNLGFRRIRVDAFLDERAAIGTDFHKMAEDYMTGKEVGGEHFTEAIQMFDRFRIWSKCHHYKVFQTEMSLVGKEFGGTIDAIGEVDGTFSVVDYKTSKKVYDDQFIQLAGYALLIRELLPETYRKLKAFGIVTMRRELAHKFVSKKELERKFIPTFKAALRLYQTYNSIMKETCL